MAKGQIESSSGIDRLAATLLLDEPVSRVKLVSSGKAGKLARLGIETVRDLLTHFPRRYIDLSKCETIASARIGEQCTIVGTIHQLELKKPRPRLDLVEITLVDQTGTMIVTMFRQPWLLDRLTVGMTLAVAGKLEFGYGFKRMTNPFLDEQDGTSDDSPGMVIPVHPATADVSAAWMRRFVGNALNQTKGLYDPLPLELRKKYRLMSRGSALRCIHSPLSMDEVDQARRRLVYEELLLLELMLMMESEKRGREAHPTSHIIDGAHMRALQEQIPFTLTQDQQQASRDLLQCLAAPRCTNHLVLGDVGTGKTVVAAFALACVADTGTQAVLMAPTEVLARQHAATLGSLLDGAGVSWELLTGSTPAKQRDSIIERMSSGQVDVLLGTHALLEPDVTFKRCSLAIIDEQQRFGVDQRQTLLEKGEAVDALYLTATPIPRTLALAVYGDLTLSYLSQRPHPASKRETKVLRKADVGIAYDQVKEALARGEQAFIVCPLIGHQPVGKMGKSGKTEQERRDAETYEYESISIETEQDYRSENITAAQTEAEMLQNMVFVDYRVGLLHGKMDSVQKQQMLDSFRAGETQILVSTTVIEVGIDVPQATVMVIMDADCFGLAQLHQLRGRVGRGSLPAKVFLVSSSTRESALSRLSAMESTEDGLELSKYDLSLRREGDILGNRQHGASVLKLVNIMRDEAVIEVAHQDAREILDSDPQLASEQYKALGREVRTVFRNAQARIGG